MPLSLAPQVANVHAMHAMVKLGDNLPQARLHISQIWDTDANAEADSNPLDELVEGQPVEVTPPPPLPNSLEWVEQLLPSLAAPHFNQSGFICEAVLVHPRTFRALGAMAAATNDEHFTNTQRGFQ